MPPLGFSSMGASVVAAAAGAPLLFGAGASGWTSYHVRDGDTLWDIAAAHRTSVSTLVRVNHLPSRDLIKAGTTLRVPTTSARRAPARMTTYRVRRGDTVSHIALRLGVPISRILKDNHLDHRGRIYAGQHLRVPAQPVKAQAKAARAAATGTTTRTYTVRSGDTVSAIAVRLHSTIAGIIKTNHLHRSGRIVPGQRLHVPVRAATVANSFAGRTYPSSIVNAAQRNRSRLATRAVPSRDAARRLIVQAAHRYGVDPALALAVAYQESGFNQRQVSVANAIGIMQVIPSSGQWASDLVGRRLDLLDARDNVTAGVVILKALTRSATSRRQAVAGYYQGLASVRARGMYVDTKAYVRSIEALVHRFD
jgi:LysM repeat protein